MKLVHAENKDIDRIVQLFEAAKMRLREAGIDQWQDGYPNAESARQDILKANGYVLLDGASLIAYADIECGFEPTYGTIYQGKWRCDETEYIFIHRIVVSAAYSGRGIAAHFFDFCDQLAYDNGLVSIRCDTHSNNLAMQKTLERNGFGYCGIILLENGDERLAYEKLLTPHSS